MKKLFCKMFLIFGLGLGFSVHSQESEWVTCNSSEGCVEYHRSSIGNIVDDGDQFIISVYIMGPSMLYIPFPFKRTCLKSDFSEGRNCPFDQ